MDCIFKLKYPKNVSILERIMVDMHTKNYKSKNISRNRSALGKMTKIKPCIPQPNDIRMTLSHFSVQAGLVLHP